MRLVFFGLLALNLLVLGWTLLSPADEPAAVVRAAPDVAPAGQSLTLIAEMDSDVQAALQKTQKPAPDSSEAVCTLVGPFVDSDRGAIVRERLRALGAESNLQSLEIHAGESYWVYNPPEPSQQEALRRLHELQAKQIDSYLIPGGELANGISFGVFTQKPLAEQRMAEMRRLGYDAKMLAKPRIQKELWLVLGPGQAARIGDEVWSNLLPPDAKQEIRQNLCSAVASSDKFL
ncbi:SPOR domain-containing protein [Simiduia agarivorans]|uniref:SPOR domain-containing protein n=1 Tax=Simiduia agarivorans (strain DSM 21679 / JCM 13881 / BCRC 17597 / SA1) TaxID=1117647 RepID=K4KLD5_SIMAS|nr:hypothetical protein [Simiduia agarivorans]AFU99035.1 hypothetical protein M5M_09240 [Simiduia agarivorans SA1 = DSM 21679]